MKLSKKIASVFIKNHDDVKNIDVRTKYGLLEGWISVIGNIILFIIKITLGLYVNSASLVTDAIHTLSDSVSSGIIIIGFYFAGKPSDKDHPFGHERIEFVIALIISILLIVTGIEMMKSSFYLALTPVKFSGSNWVIVVIFATLVLKELMARFSYDLGDLIDSDALRADAFHHRSDVFATACVIIALIGSRFGLYYLDGVMGVIVSLVIIYSGYEIAKEAVNKIIGEAPSLKSLKKIEMIAKSVAGVYDVHDIIVNSYGTQKVVSLHVDIEGSISVFEMHKIADDVEKLIEKEINGKVVVHVDPIIIDSLHKDIEREINDFIANNSNMKSFHDLRVEGKIIRFEVVLKEQGDRFSTELEELNKKIEDQFSDYEVVSIIDPHFIYNP
jgi:cation diffusion facilitator family transporter